MSRHVVAIALAVLSLCACTTMSSRDPLPVTVSMLRMARQVIGMRGDAPAPPEAN
jgi:hypothetical protein